MNIVRLSTVQQIHQYKVGNGRQKSRNLEIICSRYTGMLILNININQVKHCQQRQKKEEKKDKNSKNCKLIINLIKTRRHN